MFNTLILLKFGHQHRRWKIDIYFHFIKIGFFLSCWRKCFNMAILALVWLLRFLFFLLSFVGTTKNYCCSHCGTHSNKRKWDHLAYSTFWMWNFCGIADRLFQSFIVLISIFVLWLFLEGLCAHPIASAERKEVTSPMEYFPHIPLLICVWFWKLKGNSRVLEIHSILVKMVLFNTNIEQSFMDLSLSKKNVLAAYCYFHFFTLATSFDSLTLKLECGDISLSLLQQNVLLIIWNDTNRVMSEMNTATL